MHIAVSYPLSLFLFPPLNKLIRSARATGLSSIKIKKKINIVQLQVKKCKGGHNQTRLFIIHPALTFRLQLESP